MATGSDGAGSSSRGLGRSDHNNNGGGGGDGSDDYSAGGTSGCRSLATARGGASGGPGKSISGLRLREGRSLSGDLGALLGMETDVGGWEVCERLWRLEELVTGMEFQDCA